MSNSCSVPNKNPAQFPRGLRRVCYLEDLDDLADVELVGRLGAVELADDLGGEVLGLHVLGEEFAAEKGPPGFLVSHRFAAAYSGQTGFKVLVAVATGELAHDAQGVFVFLRIEGDGEIFVCFKVAVGVAVGPDIDRGHGLAPQRADAAPGDGHGIMVLRASGGHQRPAAVKFVECIHRKIVHVHSSFLQLQ